MIEHENPRKKVKLTSDSSKTIASAMADAEKMETESSLAKKSNFSAISPSGPIVRGQNANAKGDVKKLVIKNFKSELRAWKMCALILI